MVLDAKVVALREERGKLREQWGAQQGKIDLTPGGEVLPDATKIQDIGYTNGIELLFVDKMTLHVR